MIQRKQSIFLLIAFIVSVVCLCQPLGTVEPAGMSASFKLNNLFLDKGDSVDYSVCGLFGILLLSSVLSLGTIFLSVTESFRQAFAFATSFCSWHGILFSVW